MAYSYLALGDSYTIGEQVNLSDNFPYQTVQLLRKNGLQFYAPEIIAKTGWTTNELSTAIDATITLKEYNIVSLLIGVNNQYRGRNINEFKIEFEHLLQTAIQFAGNKSDHVFVLGIPDWGVTPFATGKNIPEIAAAIDQYNNVCENSAKDFDTHFINITTSQRIDGNKVSFLAGDNLHPSGKEYAKWAEKLARQIKQIVE